MITLSAATTDDLPAIAGLAAEMSRFYGEEISDPLETRCAQIEAALFGDSPAAHMLLAHEDGRLTGFASYSFLWPAVGLTRSLFLKELYVTTAARRTGTGAVLMRGLAQIAVGAECSRFEWATDLDNQDAQAFYAALGAAPDTSKVCYRLSGEDLSKAAM